MKGYALLCAFEDHFGDEDPRGKREIEVAAEEAIARLVRHDGTGLPVLLDLAELFYYYGQNDFQPRNQRSVSVDDVIVFHIAGMGEQFFRVDGCGFTQLPSRVAAEKHCAAKRAERREIMRERLGVSPGQ